VQMEHRASRPVALDLQKQSGTINWVHLYESAG
jgi:hypothetical protein